MWRFTNLFVAIAMLIVSVSPPQTRWDVHFNLAQRTFEANLFRWLFMISLVLYIPLLISGAALFIADLTTFARNRSGRSAFDLAFFSLVTVAALYRLNDWVFSRIF